MALPVPTESSSCDICREPLADEPTIPTTSGGAVHIRCAEEQARTAAQRRTVRTLLSGVVFFALLSLAASELPIVLDVVLVVLLIAAHVRINRRWWQYTIQRARLWWRMWS